MDADKEIEQFEKYEKVILNEKGELVTIPLRRGVADTAFIDQITFRIHKDSLHQFAKGAVFLAKDADFIEQISFQLFEVFGFGVAYKLKHSGGRFYEDCYQMGDEDVQYGRVHIGGNNDTILVEMTATGCMAALNGWESRLYDFIMKCHGARITRIDLAKDFFNGEYSPEQAKQDRLDGLFTRHRARMPAGESVGTDWECAASVSSLIFSSLSFSAFFSFSYCMAILYPKWISANPVMIANPVITRPLVIMNFEASI